ncbi:MAG: hypothetical protein ABSA05_01610 [Opitutaceae bacterium]
MKSFQKLLLGLASALLLCVGLTRLASQVDSTAARARAASHSAFTEPGPCTSPCDDLSATAAKNLTRWS